MRGECLRPRTTSRTWFAETWGRTRRAILLYAPYGSSESALPRFMVVAIFAFTVSFTVEKLCPIRQSRKTVFQDGKSHADNEMADASHKDAFPTADDLKGFLQSIWPTAADLGREVRLSPNTVANWYRTPPREMSAPNLLQALIQTGKLADFENWLRDGLNTQRPVAKRGRLRPTSRDAAKEA